ncbi:hypothetical protein SAMN04488030_0035 [Aliiroseovarius halocynthiae]|nr:hypothetical protein SAMN04488030_0035 [Aliiroseovarius halocynthiae]
MRLVTRILFVGIVLALMAMAIAPPLMMSGIEELNSVAIVILKYLYPPFGSVAANEAFVTNGYWRFWCDILPKCSLVEEGDGVVYMFEMD